MSEENGADSAPEVSDVSVAATPESEVVETQAEGLSEGEESDALEDDGFEDFEFDGKNVRIPKGLKEAHLRHADYTQKTQALAEERRAVESRREQIQEQQKFWDSAPEEFVALKGQKAAIDKQLEPYKDVNWVNLKQTDPSADEHWMFYQQLKDRKDGIERELAGKYQAISTQRNEELAKRLTETEDYARKNIKGWSKERDREILEFVESKGINKAELRSMINPQVYELLNLAYVGAKAQQIQTKVQAKPAPTPIEAPPSQTQNRAPPTRRDPARMSMTDYVAARKAGWGG